MCAYLGSVEPIFYTSVNTNSSISRWMHTKAGRDWFASLSGTVAVCMIDLVVVELDVSKPNIESVHSPQRDDICVFSLSCWWSLGGWFSSMKTPHKKGNPKRKIIQMNKRYFELLYCLGRAFFAFSLITGRCERILSSLSGKHIFLKEHCVRFSLLYLNISYNHILPYAEVRG